MGAKLFLGAPYLSGRLPPKVEGVEEIQAPGRAIMTTNCLHNLLSVYYLLDDG